VPQNIDYADELHTGQHQFAKTPVVPDASWGDAQIGATNPILATKLKHQYVQVYGQPSGTAAVTERKVTHVARAAGDVQAVEAGVVTPAVGAATVTLDLKKNGVSILTAVITITNAQAAYAKVAGALSSTSYVTGDVFELVVTAAAGGGTLPQGFFCDVVFREGPG
jgi:hypothetical protein